MGTRTVLVPGTGTILVHGTGTVLVPSTRTVLVPGILKTKILLLLINETIKRMLYQKIKTVTTNSKTFNLFDVTFAKTMVIIS